MDFRGPLNSTTRSRTSRCDPFPQVGLPGTGHQLTSTGCSLTGNQHA